jgi:hypothetical protein
MCSQVSSPELTQAVAWLALDFRVPDDWEIIRHGIGFERGSLVFVDRVRQRLSVSWTMCQRAPDLERVLSDFEQQPLTVGEKVLSQAQCEGFRLLDCEKESGERVSHALYFDPLSSRLIELEMPGSADADESALTRALLASFAFAARESVTRVRAFGLDAQLPEGFCLCASQVKPADVILEFERAALRGAGPAERLRIRRSGMARTWFDGDAARSIRLRSPQLAFDQFTSAAVGPHAAVVARGLPRRALLQRALGRAPSRRVTFWTCPAQNAVFETEVCAPRGNSESMVLPRIRCCAAHAEEPPHGD